MATFTLTAFHFTFLENAITCFMDLAYDGRVQTLTVEVAVTNLPAPFAASDVADYLSSHLGVTVTAAV